METVKEDTSQKDMVKEEDVKSFRVDKAAWQWNFFPGKIMKGLSLYWIKRMQNMKGR